MSQSHKLNRTHNLGFGEKRGVENIRIWSFK